MMEKDDMKSVRRRRIYRALQKKRKWYWFGPIKKEYTELGCPWTEKKRLGKLANTPHPCSCVGGCGHIRKFEGLTRQERCAPKVEDWNEDET
ncbi:MAG: hypothetical protein WC057_07755 [Dehalococcoidales bacterium]|jgi:hypothetical protein